MCLHERYLWFSEILFIRETIIYVKRVLNLVVKLTTQQHRWMLLTLPTKVQPEMLIFYIINIVKHPPPILDVVLFYTPLLIIL